MQAAINHLMPYTQEFWAPSAMETAVVKASLGADTRALQPAWNAMVDEALAELQSLARAHPGAVW